MHYHTSKFLQALNAVGDFFVILLAFACADTLRVLTPWGEDYYTRDLKVFFFTAALYALVLVAAYTLGGKYRTLKRTRGLAKEVAVTAVTNLLGFAFMATFIYVFRLLQFSRLLLGYFYLLSVGLIVFKRLALQKLDELYVRRHNIVPRVLLIGGGILACRFYGNIVRGDKKAMEYVGYLAGFQSKELPGYLGGVENLHEVLESTRIDRIVLAEDIQRYDRLHHIVAVAEMYGIPVWAVPVYYDVMTSRAAVDRLGDLNVVELKMQETCDIMGVHIVVTDMEKTLGQIDEHLAEWRGRYICVANVHTTVTAHEDQEYRLIQNNAVMSLPDGGPLSQFSRQQGYEGAQRVTGPDLMKRILEMSAEKGWRHYFYGSTEETLTLLRQKLEERYPGVQIAGMMSPPFREMTPQEDARAVEEINAARPDFVWVGLGAPKQEHWMAAHEGRVQALMVGVGAAFDYEAGNIKRAPAWMQKHNLEWLYRLLQDPKRLFKRYLDTNVKYLLWSWRGKG